MEGKTMDDFAEAFNAKVKTKSFEQFHLMMIDWKSGSSRQKQALYQILFVDNKSVDYWKDYVELVVGLFPERKLQLQRLISKALELLDEKQMKENPKYLAIHIALANCKSTKEDAKRYFEFSIYRKNIGRSFASLYIAWAETCQSMNLLEDAVKALQLGLDAGAEPRFQLHNEWKQLQNQVPATLVETVLANKKAPELSLLSNETNSEQIVKSTPMTSSSLLSRKLAPRGLLGSASREGQASDWSALSNDSTEESSPAPVVTPITLVTPNNNIANCTTNVNNGKPEKKASISKQELKSKYLTDSLINFKPDKKMMIVSASSVSTRSNNSTNASNINHKSMMKQDENVDECTEKMQEEEMNAILATIADIKVPPTPVQRCHSYINNNVANNSSKSAVNNSDASNHNVLVLTNSASKKSKKRVSFSAENAPPVLTAQEISAMNNTPLKATSSTSPASCTTSVEINTLPNNNDNNTINIFQDPKRLLVLNHRFYMDLAVLGKGGSSTVHKVISCSDGQLYALKRITLANNNNNNSNHQHIDHSNHGEDHDHNNNQVFDSYANEIELLKRLQNTSPYIIQLVDHVLCRETQMIALLLEMGDIDLAKLLQQRMKTHALNNNNNLKNNKNNNNYPYLDPLFARMVWKEMLYAVQHIHDHRIIHGDLKPANFVFVKGHLKLIDFGIAKHIANDNTTNIYRDSHIGTVNYMAPEAIAPDSIIPLNKNFNNNNIKNANKKEKTHQYTMKLGRASDIWSLGCILYQMMYTRPPFAALNTIQKLTAIPNPQYEISYPWHEDTDAINSIKLCLVRDPRERGCILGEEGLLNQPYVTLLHHPHSNAGNNNNNMRKTQENMVQNLVHVLKEEALATFAPAGATNPVAVTVSNKIQQWFGNLDTNRLLSQMDDTNSDDENQNNNENDDEMTEAMNNTHNENEDNNHDDEEMTETMKNETPSASNNTTSAGVSLKTMRSSAAVLSNTAATSNTISSTSAVTMKKKRSFSVVSSSVDTNHHTEDDDTLQMDEDTVEQEAVHPRAPLQATVTPMNTTSAVMMKKKKTIILPCDDKENNPHLLQANHKDTISKTNDNSDVVMKKSGNSNGYMNNNSLISNNIVPVGDTEGSVSLSAIKRRKLAVNDSLLNNKKTAVATATSAASTSSSTNNTTNNSNSTANAKNIRSLTPSFKEQIAAKAGNLRNANSAAAKQIVARWQKPLPSEKQEDLKSLMARKMEDMRKFMDIDEDNVTATESMDLSGWIE